MPRRRRTLRAAMETVPSGRWGVAVSGGADSTALFHLMCRRARQREDVAPCTLEHRRAAEVDGGNPRGLRSRD